MKYTHFESLKPLCPVCRLAGRNSAVSVSAIEAETDGDILSGILVCSACGAEYPILDGLPILIPDVRRYVQDNLFYLMARDDLPAAVESLLGDAAGPGSGLDSLRQHVSTYMWDHWADLDPQGSGRTPGDAQPGTIARNLHAALAINGPDLPAGGPILDIGCGAGRTVIELARATGRPVLGIDFSVSLARAGRKAAVGGLAEFGLRRNGMVYDRRRFETCKSAGADVDIWLCDALELPFADGTFSLTSAMNVLDCVRDPRAALVEIGRILQPQGSAIFSVPFDWSGQVTPPEAWLGGHSQRASHAGDPEAILRMLLSDGPLSAGALKLSAEPVETSWHVRLHDRSVMHYSALLACARRG